MKHSTLVRSASGVFMATCLVPFAGEGYAEVALPGHDVLRARLGSGLGPQPGDAVVVAVPEGDEPVVIAVLADHASVPLARGFRLTWTGAPARQVALSNPAGDVLLNVEVGDEGISVRLAGGDVSIEAEGRLSLEGDEVSIRSRRTNVEIEANDDIVARGERIRLN